MCIFLFICVLFTRFLYVNQIYSFTFRLVFFALLLRIKPILLSNGRKTTRSLTNKNFRMFHGNVFCSFDVHHHHYHLLLYVQPLEIDNVYLMGHPYLCHNALPLDDSIVRNFPNMICPTLLDNSRIHHRDGCNALVEYAL